MPVSDDEILDRWKVEQLSALDFGISDINALLLWNVDMHDVWRLMGSPTERTSCTPEQALRILRPLDVPVVEEAYSVAV